MLNTIKGYLGVLTIGALFTLLSMSLYGTYKVHKTLQEVAALKVDMAVENVATKIVVKQDEALAKINRASFDSTAKLQDILKDAQKENTERGQQSSPPIAPPLPLPVKDQAPAPKQTPRPVEKPKAAQAVAVAHSATTTRVIDELWDNYCRQFPAERSCDRQTDSTGTVQASAPTGQGGVRQTN